MTADEDNTGDLEVLRQRLAEAETQRMRLAAELAETNQGVVALYAELEDKGLQLLEASELKSRFLSYMTHEFRTPLSAIRSITRFLLERLDGPLTEEQVLQVQFVQKSAMELTDMVDDLLDLAKVDAGRISISPEWFELVNLFTALHGMFRPLIESDRVTLVFVEPENAPQLYTDDRKLAQILRNFISNALKFTNAGVVRVEANCPDDEHIEFVISDTGVGISADHQALLFQDFSQISSPTQKRLRGTGLGLALSRKLASLLGGTVGVESKLGVGSKFWVRIPLRYTPDISAPHPGPES